MKDGWHAVGLIRDSTESEQAESEIQHQATFARFNPNPVLELSALGEINYFNHATGAMTRALGLVNPAQMLPTDTAAMVRQCLAEGTPKLRVEKPIGPRVISWSFFPVRFNNTVHGYAGDVTERKQTEEALRLQSAALEAAANAIVITDQSGNILRVNAAFTALTGYTAQEVIGLNPRLLKSGRQDEVFYRNLWQTISSGQVWSGQLTNRRKDGSAYVEEMTITPLRNGDGAIARYIAIKQDITARKQAEEELRASEKKYQDLFVSSRDAIMILEPPSWKFTSGNPTAMKMFGAKSEEDFISHGPWDLSPDRQPDGRASAEKGREMIETAMREGSHSFDWTHRRIGDGEFPATVLLSRMQSAEKVFVQATVRDITERNRAEEELQWKTAFLEAQVNSSQDGILVVDQQGKKILQNQRAADLLKIPQDILDDKDDETQRRWVAGMTKNPEQFLEKAAYLYSHPNAISRDETEFKDGTVLDRYSSPVVGKDGKYYGRIFTLRDITAQKQTENALRASEGKFRSLFESSRDAIMTSEPPSWKFTSGNPAAVKMFGAKSEEDLILHNPWELSPDRQPDGRASAEKAKEMIEKATREGSHFFEWTHRRLGGEEFPATVLISRMQSAEKVFHQSTVRDITESKRAEEVQTLLASVVQSSEDAIIYGALDGIILTWNQGAERIYGYAASEVIGKSFTILVPPDRLEEIREVLEKIRRGEYISHHETVRRTKDGRRIEVSLSMSPMRDASGIPTGVSIIGRDITGRKRLEATLFQSQKMETVGKLAGGIAHEFNSIMTAIIGQSELMLYDLPEGNPLRKNAAEIQQAAGRAATLTRQLLAYGRKQIFQPEVLDLNTILAGMEKTLCHLAGRDVDVLIAPPTGPRLVKADPGQIEQVIVNIVMNAAEAMPRGGKLTLETAETFLDQAYVSQFQDLKAGQYIMLAITDTGAGMSEAVKARLFEPFFTTKEVGKGTGLGLATCHGIIKQSGGHINVYSEPGRGATFKIYLPKAPVENKPPAPPLKTPDLPRGTETILLVEDDPALREMAAILLRRLGYTVLPAGDGLEALNLTHQRATGHIDLLFTDVVMPHMSGKELSDRIQALYPHTKVLFTSAYTETAIVHQNVLNPGITLLQKPFTPSSLAKKVREVLDQTTAPPTAP
jgi:PAS domain S-box-containing protein